MNDIFDYNFFEDAIEDVDVYDEYGDSAMEVTEMQLIGAAVFILTRIASDIRRSGYVNKRIADMHMRESVLDVDALMKTGMSRRQAENEYRKTVNFLISKNFVKDNITPQSTSITYSDLTKTGLVFIYGYYDKLGKIDVYTIKNAIKAKNHLGIITTANIFGAVIEIALYTFGAVSIGGILGVLVWIMSACHTAIAAYTEYAPTYYFDKQQPENISPYIS